MKAVIFDLDQTLIDSSIAEVHRKNRNWSEVYKLIPSITPYPGIQDMLQVIRKLGYKCGLVTSAPRTYTDKVLAFNSWFFDSLVCYHDTQFHKPHPQPIERIVELLRVDKQLILSVGDRSDDIVASKRAGVKTGACYWGASDIKSLRESDPTYHFIKANELTHLLSLNKW